LGVASDKSRPVAPSLAGVVCRAAQVKPTGTVGAGCCWQTLKRRYRSIKAFLGIEVNTAGRAGANARSLANQVRRGSHGRETGESGRAETHAGRAAAMRGSRGPAFDLPA
jgi:hypothetical protein